MNRGMDEDQVGPFIDAVWLVGPKANNHGRCRTTVCDPTSSDRMADKENRPLVNDLCQEPGRPCGALAPRVGRSVRGGARSTWLLGLVGCGRTAVVAIICEPGLRRHVTCAAVPSR